MSSYQLRPSFQIPLGESRQTAIQKLTDYHQQHKQDPLFVMTDEYGELKLPPGEHRLWSPYMTFYLYQKQGEDCIFCRFAPRPHIWTCVWAIYISMTFTIFFSLMFAFTQLLLQQPPWALWISLGAGLILAIIYMIAGIGQSLSVDQIEHLHKKFDSIIAAAQVKILSTECQENPSIT